MEITRNQSEALELRQADANGMEQTTAYISYTIRPGQGMSINVDIHNAALVAQNKTEIQAAINAFIAEAVAKAASLGIPVGKEGIHETI